MTLLPGSHDVRSGHTDGGESSRQTGQPEVDALFGEMEAAWHEGDALRFSSVFAQDARFVAFDGTVLTGPDEIAAYHARPFASHLAGTELRHEAISVRSAARNVFVVASEGGIVRDGRREGELIGRSAQTFVIETRDGVLRITAFQNTRIRPIDGPRAADVWRTFDQNWSQLT